MKDPNVSSYMEYWEGRATKAEADRARLRAALERIAYKRPPGECKNKLVEFMERQAVDALRGFPDD
jgi:hypothetical protein